MHPGGPLVVRTGFRVTSSKAQFTKVRPLGGTTSCCSKPMTYMNLSGESVQAAMRFFQAYRLDRRDLPCTTSSTYEFGVVRA